MQEQTWVFVNVFDIIWERGAEIHPGLSTVVKR